MNGNYFYANWKQREIVNKGIIPVRKFKVVTLFFINLGLILFHWEMFQIAWDFMCLLFGYDRCYILKDQNSGDYFCKKQNLKIGFDAAFSVNCRHK